MAPKAKKTAAAAAEEEIEEIVPEPPVEEPHVTFVLGDEGAAPEDLDEEAPEDEDLEEGDDLEIEDELATAVGQLTQLMMTEEGEAISDVLHGIRDAIDKQNKILYRGLQLLEAKLGRR